MFDTVSSFGYGGRSSRSKDEPPIGIASRGHSSRSSKNPIVPGRLVENHSQAADGQQQAGRVKVTQLQHFKMCTRVHSIQDTICFPFKFTVFVLYFSDCFQAMIPAKLARRCCGPFAG